MFNGNNMYDLAVELFPLNRSLTGNGVRKTLNILKKFIPELEIREVECGTKAFDWTIPEEWSIEAGYIENSKGERIIDFANNNLHIMGYSAPVDKYVTRQELLEYIYVEETRPKAIPYVTSYYKKRFGFCMSMEQRDQLPDDEYHIVIKSNFIKGSMTYAEVLIPSTQGTDEEIFFSTYICHPSMANNELSGPCLATALIDYVKGLKKRKYNYRFLFAPETIGSIYYLSINLERMKKNVKAGYVLSCVGDNRTFSYVPSRKGDTLADRAALNVLNHMNNNYIRYSFLDRASDERQYCSIGVDLPVCVVCRSKYGCYPEYHTSDDDLSVISAEGLQQTKEVYIQIIDLLEYNEYYFTNCCCEPQLGKRGLYPTISKKNSYDEVVAMMDLLAYADGCTDLIGISDCINQRAKVLIPIVNRMLQEGLIVIKNK